MASWSNGNQLLRQFAFQTGSPVPGVQQHGFTFFYDYDDHHDYFHNHPFSGSANDDHEQLMMKSSRPAAENKPLPSVGLSAASKKNTTTTTIINNNKNSDHNYQQEMMMRIMRKRKLTSNQIDALETSFQEEVKLEPDRKMKLSRELGLHPRQVAVWFQNRRARWKAKQLQRLYSALRQEFDIISREKQNLQQEVMNLKARLDDITGIQGSTSYTEVASLEETVESTSIAIRSSNGGIQGTSGEHQVAPGSYFFSIDDYNINPDSLPYWDIVPGCP